MYAHIRGTVSEILPDRVVLDACGVGYELYCSAQTRKCLRAGAEHGVTRVGPKLALSVLSVLSVSDIAGAILTENAAAFDKVPGMGRKTAARVLLELKEKIGEGDMASVGLPQAAATGLDMRGEAIAALVSLGYDGVTAGRAVAAVGECAKVEDMITQALRELAKRG